MNEIAFKPIGIIRSPFGEIKGMPIQPKGAKGIKGIIEVYPEFEAGLKDIDIRPRRAGQDGMVIRDCRACR
ncbi:MAG: hypothetical protein HY779_00990 [Rubrobacteridae bacterium]|nr:hypothetical protein [Rubrobacteridae bacterium]